MATTLSVGDVAIVQYNTSTDAFTFVFLRDVEAGTIVNFTDNGWLAAGGFRPGENTVTYTAPSAITKGTIVTLSGLDLDAAGDQIIAYQGAPAAPTILHLVDFADGNNTVAGDATDDNTTALPLGFTLGVNAVAVGFDSSLYAGPISGSPAGLFTALNNPANWLGIQALAVPFAFDARPTTDLDANNSSGAFGFDYLAFVTSGGPAVPVSDTDVNINDADDNDLLAAEIRIIGPVSGDLLAITGSLPPGIVARPYNAATGVLRLDGLGFHSAYETAIRQVRFSTTDSPGDLKSIQVSVFDGVSWSHDTVALLHVVTSLGGAPPALDLDANNSTGGGRDATATYQAGGAAVPVTDTDVLITDDGGTIQSAKINILDYSLHTGDRLSIAGTLPAGITASSYNAFNGEITLSGSASLAAYQTALRQVVFSSTLGAPSTADRTIQVSVNDGHSESNIATMYMHVVIPPPNAAPVLDLDANNSTTTGANYLTGFTESVPPVPVAIADVDIRITDLNNLNVASATITLTNPQAGDRLTFTGTPPLGIVVSGSGTNVITLTGVAFNDSYELALRQIRYSNDSVDPSNVTRTVEVVVSDGIANSNVATALVQVEAVNNSAPVIDLDPNDSSASTRTTFRTVFTENGPSLPIADTDISIIDLDSTTLFSATITLANQQAGDLLTVIGALPPGIVASAYDPATGVLTFTGTATLDAYETALLQVRYSNTSDNPATEDRLIEVVVSDGVNASNVAAAVITVVAVNDPPVLTVDPSEPYVENGAIIPLSPLATVTDLDDAELSQAVVTITDGTIPGDGDTLTVAGLTDGTEDGITFHWDAAEHAMVMTGASSLLNYRDLLQRVGFHSTSDNPTDFGARTTRTLTWSVSDGAAVTTATTTLAIVAVNDAPQATVAATASYTENAAPVVLSPAATATDADNTTLVTGEVRIVSTAVDGDLLTVNGLQSGTFAGIQFSYDAVLYDLTFSGPTTVADYQAFLQAVAFSSTSDNPTDFGLNPTRTLSWFVFDGDALSEVQTTVVSITASADAPVNTVPAAQSAAEDTTLAIAGVSVADVDSTALTATLSVLHGTLNVTTGGGATIGGNGSGTVTIGGTAAQINNALAGLSYRGNLNFNGADTLTVTTTDGSLNDTDTVPITVTAVNDQPVNTVPGPLSVNEDTTLPIGVSVADVDGTMLTTTLTVASGTLTVTTGGAVIGGNGTGSVTIQGTAVQINNALAGLIYRGNLNHNGADTLTVITSDGALSDTDTVPITVNAVNDAPANTVPGARSVAEDTTLAITGVSVADVDSTALTATLTVVNGTLTVATGGGATIGGNGSGTVTIGGTAGQINNALAGLSYRGNLNFNGADTLTVTTTDGALNDIDTVPITVTAANDPPVSTVPGPQTVAEDTTLAIAGVSVADVDGTALTATLSVSHGTLNVTTGGGATIGGNGTGSVTIGGTAAQINSALAALSYRGNLNFNGADTLTVTTSDGSLSDTDTVPITVNALNDPPVNAVPGAQSVAEDTTLALTGVSVADVDSTALIATLTVAHGTLNVTTGGGATIGGNGSGAVTISGSAAQINTALGTLSYHGNLNFSGADTLTVTTTDGSLNDTDTVPITVTAANDPPVNTVPGSRIVNEDTTLAITGVSIADVDSTALTTTLTVANGTLSATGAGVAGSGTATLTISGSATQINTALGTLSYRGNLNFNGADTLTVTTSDGSLSDTDTVAITVNAVNDAPVNTVPGPQTVAEDTTLAIAGISVADLDSTALTATLSVASGTLTVATGGGAVIGGNGSGSVTISGSAAQINSALAALSYRGNLNFTGADTLTVTTADGALNDTDTVPITVNAANDPPVNTVPGTQSVAEDTTLPITGLSVADVDNTTLTTTLSVTNGTLTVAAGGGALITGSGTNSVVINGTATQINNALATLHYHGNPDFNGSDTLTVATSDGSSSDTDTVAITVNAVNDAPVNTVPGPQTVAEDTTLPIAGISVADLDSTALTTTLSVTNGTLTVATGGGALVTGSGTNSVVINGTATQINDALAGLSYLGNLDFNGSDTLTVATSDGSLSDTDVVGIAVGAAGDPPVNTVPGSQTVDEDTVLPIAGVSVADVDSTVLTTTLSVANGTLEVTGAGVSGSGTATVTITGSPTQVNAALATLAYLGDPDFNGPDTLTVSTFDGSLTDTDTVAITVNAVSDSPVNTVPGAQSVNEDTALLITGVSVADVDSTALTATLTVAHGRLTATGTGVSGSGSATLTIAGTAEEINTALGTLSYLGDLDFHGADTLTVTTSDGSLSDTDTVAITVNAINDRPVNTVPLPQTVAEDTALPIAGVSVADTDSTALTTTLSVTSGILNVTAGAGVSGNGTGTVTITGTAVQINAALAGLSYLGNLNFNGADTLTVSTSDGALTDTDTIGITVNAVSDPPVNTVPGAQSVDEDTALPITSVSVADVDSTALTATLTVAHGRLTATGTGVSGSGSATLTIAGTAEEINTALGTLSYLGDLDFHGADTLTVTTSDGSLSDTDTVAITVNAVNDAPDNTVPLPQTVAEDTVLPIAGVSVADVDSTALTTTLSVTSGILNVTAGAGVSGNGTGTVTITGTAVQINAALAGLSYLGNLNFNNVDTLTVSTSDGALTDTDTVEITVNAVNDPPANTVPGAQSVNEDTTLPIAGVAVSDSDSTALSTTLSVTNGILNVTAGGGVSGNGTGMVNITGTAAQINTALAGLSYLGNPNFQGADTLTVATSDGSLSDTDTVPITVHAVNDVPVNTLPPAQTVDEDTVLPITGLSVADSDSTALLTTLSVTHGTLTVTGAGPGARFSASGSNTVSIAGTAAEINAALGTLTYLGDPGFNGADTLTVTTSDGVSNDTDTVAITVDAVNDPPVNTVPGAQSINEDATFLLIHGVSVADVDGTTLTTTLTVASGTLNVSTGGGATIGGNGSDSVTIGGTAAQINSALAGLSYVGNLNFHGADTLTVATSDGEFTDTDTVGITVNPVDDPPVNTVPGPQSAGEDTVLPIAGLSVTDTDSSLLVTTLTVAHGTLTATGTGISGSGTATLTITGTSTEVNAALGTLSYLGNPDFNGADTLTVTTSDGSSSDTDTVPITVNAVNDPPVNTVPGARSVNEDTPLSIGGVSVADADGAALTTTLSVTNGTLTVATGGGATIGGNGTGSVTIGGTATQINSALAGLSYLGNLDFNGPDTLTVATSDGAVTDTDTVAITVNAVNDPPVNTVPGAQSVNEDSTLAIGGVSVADVDGATLTTILGVVSGILTVGAGGVVSNNGTGTVTISGSATQINASLATLTYRGHLDFSGPDTLTVGTSDGALTDADSVAITVNAVNDRPALDLDADNSSGAAGLDYTATFVEGGSAVAIADGDALITDVDNANLASATITLANHQPGDLLSVGTLPAGITASPYDPATGVLTLTGAATFAAYEAALRQIAFSNSSPTPSAADRLINIVVSDGAASSPAAHAFVHVVPVATAPALDLDANNSSGAVGADYTAVFVAGGAAVPVPVADADTLIADADSSNIVAATITLTNAEATDFLAANGDLPTGISGAFDPGTGIFTLTGSASLAAYQAALRQIEFGSSDPNPLTATRVIEVVVNDGSTDSNTALSLIQIAVSAPPTLDLDADDSTASGSDYATIFTEGGPPVQLADSDILFSSPVIASATITLTNPFPGDLLTVIGELPPGITFTYDPVTFVLILTGPGTPAAFNAAVRSVSSQVVYTNTDPNPSTETRIITVVANDGTNDSNVATAIVNFASANDPPSLSVAPDASYTEHAAAVVVSPDVTISDPDNPTLTIGIAAITAGLTPGDVLTIGGLRSGLFGSLAFDWAPTLNELIVTGEGTPEDYEALFQSVRFHSDSDDPTNGGADPTRTVSWAVFDGATTTVATTTLTLTAINDAPVNAIPATTQEVEANTATAIAGLSVSDVDAGAGTLTTTLSVTNGTLTVPAGGAAVAGSGTATVTLTGTLAQINATLAGNVIYRGAQDFFGTDTLTMATSDGGSTGTGGLLTDADQLTIHLNTHLTGTPNDDSFTALPGNERIDALASTDTITFGFRLVDATVTYVGNTIIIDGPGSHTVATGFETYVFTDGTVHCNDENWLVDDLFYYSRNHDVWNDHADADVHYDTFGWHEGRDPSFFFSTTMYLSANPDVAAAGVNPLDHWHDFGWIEGRVPSLNFGPQQYLAAYPDVAAEHVDPLRHFLEFGHDELREPFPSGQVAAANGFDYVYYLQHNPDVAATGADPFAHYMTVGWAEGRNPNALFDANGYLANYPDVAAANVNPLEHYRQFGWHEGRDPSVGFDTTAYLAAYPDVAAAGVDPLTHYLQYGILEGRSPFADGIWG